MGTESDRPNEGPPTDFAGWERALTRRYLMVGPNDDASPIRSFGVSPEGLAEAAAFAGDRAAERALAGFRAAVCRGAIVQALMDGTYPSGLAPREVPGCFAYLVVTLLAANQPTEATGFGGDYWDKLAAFVGHPGRFSRLHGVARMWTELRDWLDRRRADGLPFRSLVLPYHPPGWKRTGYTLRLAFPTKPDATLLAGFLTSHPALASNARGFLHAFQAAMDRGSASKGLQEAFAGFRQSFDSGDRMLADHPFWILVRSCTPQPSGATAAEAQAEVTFDEDDAPLFAVARTDDGEPPLPRPSLSATVADLAATQRPAPSLARGFLVFRQAGYGRWLSAQGLDGSPGRMHLGCSGSAFALLREHKTRFFPSGTWHFTREPVGAGTAEVIASMLGVRPDADRLSSASVSDGIRTGGLWLGRPGYLPRIVAEGQDLIVRPCSETSGTVETAPDAEDPAAWRLRSAGPVTGSWLVEPAGGRLTWSRRLAFAPNAVPHADLGSPARSYDLLTDWRTSGYDTIGTETVLDRWEATDGPTADLVEAVYASGRSGLPEGDLVRLVRAGLGDEAAPWTVIRMLRDAAVIEPRLRPGWAGRIWTLRLPTLRVLGHAAIAEGALCERLTQDFKASCALHGSRPFRFPGAAPRSPALFGCVGGDIPALAKHLGWELAEGAATPIRQKLAFSETTLRILGREARWEWDWGAARFLGSADVDPAKVRLRRWVQPGGNDHDIYTVDAPGWDRQRRYLSRTAAVAMAHCTAGVPLFAASAGRLVGLAREACLPDAVAARLRLRHAANPGIADGAAVHAADDRDLRWLATIMPGLVAEAAIADRARPIDAVASARHSRGRIRFGWSAGGLSAMPTGTPDRWGMPKV